jgi:hypothetical protein
LPYDTSLLLPSEFRNIGCLPAGHFIPSLMAHLEEKYYAGLLSAARLLGELVKDQRLG